MQWLILLFLACLALLAALLLAPIRVQVALAPGQRQVSIFYLGFAIFWDQLASRTDLCFLGCRLRSRPGRELITRPTPTRPPTGPAVHEAASRSRLPESVRRIRLLWSYRLILRRTVFVAARLVGRLWRSWRLESGRLQIVFGSKDPALTGLASGLFWAMRPTLHQQWPMLAIDWQPIFAPAVETTLRVEATLVYRVIPVEPSWAVARALGTLPWRGLIRLKKAWAL
jgi:hypothetical protein